MIYLKLKYLITISNNQPKVQEVKTILEVSFEFTSTLRYSSTLNNDDKTNYVKQKKQFRTEKSFSHV